MPVPSPLGTRATVAALLAVTFVTGLVDAVSYLRMGRVFVANMTGNIVFLGFTAAPHSGLSVVSSLVALGGFAVGAVAGGRLSGRTDRHPRQWLALALAAEGVIIGVAAALAGTGVLSEAGRGSRVTTLLLAIALGLQTATVRHLGAHDLTTTVLSLTVAGLAADSVLGTGLGSQATRRLGSILAMLAGAASGAALLRVTEAGVLGLAAAIAFGVALAFGVGQRSAAATPSPAKAG